jgi:lysozyme
MDKVTVARSRSKTITIVCILIIAALLVSVLPQFTQVASAQTCSKKYTVVSGDTLSSIAAKYNTSVQVLADLNDLTAPYVLSVGQVICLPAGAQQITATPSSGSSSSKPTYEMAVTRDGTRITLKVASFPKNSNYHVRIGEALRHSGWTRIGKMKTNKNGAGEATYGLPKDLRNVPSYYICLKDQITDKLACAKFTQTVVNPRATAKPTARPTFTPTP